MKDFIKEFTQRLTSRKFLLSLTALALVVLDIAEAVEVAIVIAPFVGAEGLKDAIYAWKNIKDEVSTGNLPSILGGLTDDDDDYEPDRDSAPVTGNSELFDEEKRE